MLRVALLVMGLIAATAPGSRRCGAPFINNGSQSGEPQDPGSGYLYQDNFNYASTATMFNPPQAGQFIQCFPTTDLSLVTPGYDGTGKACRVTIPDQSGPEYDPGTFTGPINPDLGTSYSGALVWQYYFRLSTSWRAASVANKWMYVYYSGYADRTEISPLVITGGSRFHVNPGDQAGGVSVAPQPVGPYVDWTRSGQPAALNDGLWHRFTAYYKRNTTVGARDCDVRAWIDGIQIMYVAQAQIGVTPAGGDRAWCDQAAVDAIGANRLVAFNWFGNFRGSTVAATQDLSALKVWTV